MATGVPPLHDRPPADRRGTAASPQRRTAGDLVALAWRRRGTMLAVLVSVLALGAAASRLPPTLYTAKASLILVPGRDGAPSAVSEAETLSAAGARRGVLRRIGAARLYPGRSEAGAAEAMARALKVEAAEAGPVVRLSFTHRDPQLAAEALNALIDDHMAARAAALADRRDAVEARLGEVDAALARLTAGGGDFETEKAAAGELYADLLGERYELRARLGEVEARLSAVARSAASAPAEVGLFRDLDASAATTVRRVGLNPARLRLQAEKEALEGEAAAVRAREAAVARELEEAEGRRQALTRLEPGRERLAREREALAAEAAALYALPQEGARLVERVEVPVEGRSPKGLVIGLSAIAAVLAALGAGLALAIRARGYPSVAAVERSLDLPVLAAMPLRREAARR